MEEQERTENREWKNLIVGLEKPQTRERDWGFSLKYP